MIGPCGTAQKGYSGMGTNNGLPGARALATLVLATAGLLLALCSTTLQAVSPTSESSAMTQPGGSVSYARLYVGTDGVSHFSNEQLPLVPAAGGQGLGTLSVNRIGDVQGVMFAQLKAGSIEDWHVAPQRLLMVCVHGVVEITAADGQKRRLTPGQVMLLEDTRGKGHITHAVGPEDHVALAIPVPDGVLTR
jgi:hypothetical protein